MLSYFSFVFLMNTNNQYLFQYLDVIVQSLILDCNITHKQINNHIRDFIVFNLGRTKPPVRVLYTDKEDEIAFSKDFIIFTKLPAQFQPIRDSVFLQDKIHEFGLLIANKYPFIPAFIYMYQTYNLKTISCRWLKLKEYKEKIACVCDRLRLVEQSLEMMLLDTPEDRPFTSDSSPVISPTSSCSNLSLTKDIVCFGKRSPNFSRFKTDVLFKSKFWLKETLKELSKEADSLENSFSNPNEKLLVNTFDKHCQEIEDMVRELGNLAKSQRFLVSEHITFMDTLNSTLPYSCWAFQHRFDLHSMVFLETLKNYSYKNKLSPWILTKHTLPESRTYIWDMILQKYVECPVIVLLFILEEVGLIASGAPWCNVKYQDVPAYVDWSIRKTDKNSEQVIW